MSLEETISRLKAELRNAESLLAEAKKEAAKAVIPNYSFALIPEYKPHMIRKLMDSTCRLYVLHGTVNNREELRRVGKTPVEGSMSYVFNSKSGLFVMAVSGGTEFTDNHNCWLELSDYIRENPMGGDVTHIVNAFRNLGPAS